MEPSIRFPNLKVNSSKIESVSYTHLDVYKRQQVTYRKHWQRYCSHNKIAPVTLYELRHTFVSVAKMLPVGEVKQLVGHSKSMDTFGVYGHALDGEDVQTAQKINGLFERIISPEKPAEK